MPPQMKPVFSQSVREIGHDAATGELHVAWANGRRSIYAGVPAELAEHGMKAWSVGGFVHEVLKPNYQHRYHESDTGPTPAPKKNQIRR